MKKFVSFFKRNPNLTREQFRQYYEESHARLFDAYLTHPGVERYVRRYLSPATDSISGVVREADFDVVMEVWLSDANFYQTYNQAFKDLVKADEEKLFSRDHMYFHTVEEVDTDLAELRRNHQPVMPPVS